MGRQQDEVVIYWRPDCVFCLDLLLRLRWTRLRYRKVGRERDGADRGGGGPGAEGPPEYWTAAARRPQAVPG